MFLRFIFRELLTPQSSKKNKLCTLLIALECKQDTHKTNPEGLQPAACITHYPYIPTPLSLEIHSSSSHTFVSNQKYICFSWCKALSKRCVFTTALRAAPSHLLKESEGLQSKLIQQTSVPCSQHTGDTDICTEIFMGTLRKGFHTLGELQWSAELLHPDPLCTALTASDKPLLSGIGHTGSIPRNSWLYPRKFIQRTKGIEYIHC